MKERGGNRRISMLADMAMTQSCGCALSSVSRIATDLTAGSKMSCSASIVTERREEIESTWNEHFS